MSDIALEKFKSNLYDICRPNRFKVSIQGLESDFEFKDEDYYFVKGASLPGRSIGEIDLNWQGHKYKILGDPTFSDVTITFWNNYNSSGDSIRDKFENWFYTSSDDANNLRGKHTEYKATVTITQLNGDGEMAKRYDLIFAHPKELSDIELSMDSTDAVEEFTVVFSYSYLEVTYGDGGSLTSQSSGGGGIAGALGSIVGGLKTINSVVKGVGTVFNTTSSTIKGFKGFKKGLKDLF